MIGKANALLSAAKPGDLLLAVWTVQGRKCAALHLVVELEGDTVTQRQSRFTTCVLRTGTGEDHFKVDVDGMHFADGTMGRMIPGDWQASVEILFAQRSMDGLHKLAVSGRR